MAQKVQTLFIDDLDGSDAEGTVRFGLDGAEYEIDLNVGHARELRDALSRYVGAARRVGGAARRPAARGSRRGSPDGVNTTEVREWARSHGIEVKDRGRIPAGLVVKFKAAAGEQERLRPAGAGNHVTLWGLGVLVDQATEPAPGQRPGSQMAMIAGRTVAVSRRPGPEVSRWPAVMVGG